ncbi:hypothetical protein GmRootV59_02350 [Variovorax sp. V59]|uniref:hypothetical protein n=1 Tax=unclassified Variovorax TaxID=663243 RepID=UPI0034E898C0
MTKKDSVELFWKWFQASEAELSTSYHEPKVMKNIDLHVHRICPDLSWEIGPVDNEGLYFSLSPDLDEGLMGLAKKSIARSYKSTLWKFLVGRQRRPWSSVLEVLDDELNATGEVDLSKWKHIAYRVEEDLIDIVFSANCSNCDTERLSRIANIVAVGLLGEVVVMEKVNSIEVLNFFEDEMEAVAKPVHWLPYAFGMKPMT